MNILVTCDSFKDCLSAEKVGEMIISGIKQSFPESVIVHIPIADGGEGSLEAIKGMRNMRTEKCEVVDPLLRQIEAGYLVNQESSTAYIEMAATSGLELLKKIERDCYYTSTYGTGMMINNAKNLGLKNIILFIGGSATSDMGIGMAAAMGVDFFDKEGIKIPFPRGYHLAEIDDFRIPATLRDLKITIVCDVENPLCGPNGASYTYGPQKGGNDHTIPLLDQGMKNLNKKMASYLGKDYSDIPGAGAAGGIGAMCKYLFDSSFVIGADFMFNNLHIEDLIINTDLIITGEGKMDSQTLNGKLIKRLGDLARIYHKDMEVICGTILLDETDLKKMYIKKAYSLSDITNNAIYTPESTIQVLSDVGKEIGIFYAS